MGLFTNIFKKTEKLEPFDIGRLKVDIHSHLIPGIDDGAQDMDQSIAMLNKFQSMGLGIPMAWANFSSPTGQISERSGGFWRPMELPQHGRPRHEA